MICEFKDDKALESSTADAYKSQDMPSISIGLANMSQAEKDEILLTFENSQEENFELPIDIICIIAFENICQNQNTELAINALIKVQQNNLESFFPHINEIVMTQLLNLTEQFANENSVPLLLKTLGLLSYIIDQTKSTPSEQFLFDFLVQSQFLNTLVRWDLKEYEVSKLIWTILKFRQISIENDQIEIFFQNGFEALRYFTQISSDNHIIAKAQIYLLKSISALPVNPVYDSYFVDICIHYLTFHPNFKVKANAIRAIHRKKFKNPKLSTIILDIILQLNSKVNHDATEDKLIKYGLEYLNFAFDCWFIESMIPKSEIDSNRKKIAEILLFVLDNKSFEIATVAIKIIDQIIKINHQVDLNIEKALINHIDTTPIGYLCLILSFQGLDSLSSKDLVEAISTYIENIDFLIDFAESDFCDKVALWAIEYIFHTIDEICEDEK